MKTVSEDRCQEMNSKLNESANAMAQSAIQINFGETLGAKEPKKGVGDHFGTSQDWHRPLLKNAGIKSWDYEYEDGYHKLYAWDNGGIAELTLAISTSLPLPQSL